MKIVAFLSVLLSFWAVACVAWMELRYAPAGGDAQYVFLWDRWENRLCLVSVDAPARIICDPRTLWVSRGGARHEGPAP
ncbi:hypothetical protein [Pseudomonas panipatensis]|uniref:Uncharacterized protein n=1 Tax=Pseudomonas panipatensis TaxID=428992 RepID=A0A1G8FS69_9PSED|nr:hypothetical protein [Pseudomonas panipatensis]SDH84957.1 hypothetical protein SAMN05216272_103422 [Pseudomonas panipatensis]SMP52427.1 hypothetical protein SAMN06295951_10337 [Pseudomonas panipatensis]